METHECANCKKVLPSTVFTEASGQIRSKCYSCRYLQTKERRKKKAEENLSNTSNIKVKTCVECDKELSIDNFNKRLSSNDGYNRHCRGCYKKLRHKSKTLITTTTHQKVCLKCNTLKTVSDFKTTSKSKDGYYHTCISCLPLKQWNKEKQKLSERKYIQNNKEKLREKWKRDGLKINRRIRDRLNHRIWDALLSSRQRKTNKTSAFIGCDIPFLKKWFEFQFVENMNWENIHLWHIDHVNPCKSFDLSLETEQYKCFHWSNLRPCWAEINLEKSDTIDELLINKQKEKAEQFLQSTTNSS